MRKNNINADQPVQAIATSELSLLAVQAIATSELSLLGKAQLAQMVYPDQRKKPLPAGWTLIGYVDSEKYCGGIFKCEKVATIYMVHCGTRFTKDTDFENLKALAKDLIADIQSTIGKIPDTYNSVVKSVCNNVHQKYEQAYAIIHVGHSLGGIYAQLAAVDFKTKAVTFDSPGCKVILDQLNKHYSSQDLINYICHSNLVNSLNIQAGKLIKLGLPLDPKLILEIAFLEAGFVHIESEIKNCEKMLSKSPPLAPAIRALYATKLANAWLEYFSSKVTILKKTHGIELFIHKFNDVGIGIFTQPNINQQVQQQPMLMQAVQQPQHQAKMKIWMQDPSYASIKEVHLFSDSPFNNGPKNAVIEILTPGQQIHKQNDGNFLYEVGYNPNAADAAHTFAIAYKVWLMYREVTQLVGIPWQGKWLRNGEYTSSPLLLAPNAFIQANAFYNNNGLIAFGKFKPNNSANYIHACRSFDIVAHETGHAILHSLKPQWQGSSAIDNYSEMSALHEAFGDLTSMFLFIRDPDLCKWLISVTEGNLRNTSPLTLVGEEMGLGLGIRNLFNTWKLLQTSSECHDASQVFSGAIYDILVGIYETEAKKNGAKPTQNLTNCANGLLKNFLAAIYYAPNRNPTFKDVAELMVRIEKNEPWKLIIKEAFEKREILSEDNNDERQVATKREQLLNKNNNPHLCATANIIFNSAENRAQLLSALSIDANVDNGSKNLMFSLPNANDETQLKVDVEKILQEHRDNKKLLFSGVSNSEEQMDDTDVLNSLTAVSLPPRPQPVLAESLHDLNLSGQHWVPKGAIVAVLKQNNDGSCKIRYQGQTGTIQSNNIKIIALAESLHNITLSGQLWVQKGTIIAVLEQNSDGSCKIKYQGQTGIIQSNNVKIIANDASVVTVHSQRPSSSTPPKQVTTPHQLDRYSFWCKRATAAVVVAAIAVTVAVMTQK